MAEAALVPVKLGRADAGRLSVTGELQESDWVVTRGNESLRGGEDLIIMNPPPPPPTPAQQQQAQQAQAKSTTMTTATTQPVPAQEQ